MSNPSAGRRPGRSGRRAGSGDNRQGPPSKPATGQASGSEREARTLAEGISFVISLVILLGIVGLVTYVHFTRETTSTTVEVRPLRAEIRRTDTGFYVPVEIDNTGGQTAEDVRVVLVLRSTGGHSASAELSVPFLAGHASHRGTVVFVDDPASGELAVESVSYKER